MKTPDKSRLRDELRAIPGVGPSISRDLRDLGYRRVSDLKGEDAESMYVKLCTLRRQPIDKCMLYVFRCAVYYANNTTHDPEKLKWWNWKNKR